MDRIVQCKLCNRLFQKISLDICQNCVVELDEAFITIREYLYEHSEHTSVEELSEATGVKEEMIIRLIKEKRITTSHPIEGALVCMYCKKPINGGTMCESCKESLAQKLDGALPKAEKKEPERTRLSSRESKMHIDPFSKRR